MKDSRVYHIRKAVGILFALGVFPLYLEAQRSSLELRVVDADNGNGIEFATVQWKPVGASDFKDGSSTNQCGLVSIPAGIANIYIVSVRCVGYETTTDTLKTSINKHTIRLRPNARPLDGVVVTGKSKAQIIRESPEAISVISGKELSGRTISLESALNKTIGLKIGQSGGLGSRSRIIVHGLEGNRIRIL